MKTKKETTKYIAEFIGYIAASEIVEIAEAFDNYEKMPQASKDNIQVISDMYGLTFDFKEHRKKLVLTGMTIPYILDTTFLFVDNEELFKKQLGLLESKKPCLHVIPGGNNKLYGDEYEEILDSRTLEVEEQWRYYTSSASMQF